MKITWDDPELVKLAKTKQKEADKASRQANKLREIGTAMYKFCLFFLVTSVIINKLPYTIFSLIFIIITILIGMRSTSLYSKSIALKTDLIEITLKGKITDED